MVLAGIIYRKEEIIGIIQDCVDFVSTHCFYCNSCWECLVAKKLQKEASEKNLKNTEKKWWSIEFILRKDPIPYLVSH